MSSGTNLDLCNSGVPNTPDYNIQAIEATELYAPYCTTEYSQEQGAVDVGLGLIFRGENAVNTATTQGCQNYTKVMETYYTSACTITNILNSVSSAISQDINTTQTITVVIENSQVYCDEIIVINESSVNVKSVQNMSIDTETEIQSALSSSIKSLFAESVNTIIDGGNSSAGDQVIKDFNSQITNSMFTNITNEMKGKLNQLYSGKQELEYYIKNSVIVDCSLMKFSNSFVIDMEAYVAAISAVDTAISQTTFVQSLNEFALSLDKLITTSLDPPETSSKGWSIFATILAIGICIALVIGIIYLLSKPKKAKQASELTSAVTDNISTGNIPIDPSI